MTRSLSLNLSLEKTIVSIYEKFTRPTLFKPRKTYVCSRDAQTSAGSIIGHRTFLPPSFFTMGSDITLDNTEYDVPLILTSPWLYSGLQYQVACLEWLSIASECWNDACTTHHSKVIHTSHLELREEDHQEGDNQIRWQRRNKGNFRVESLFF